MRPRAEAADRLLRIKVSPSTRIQAKISRIRIRKNDVAQAAYAFAATLLLCRVEITLSGYAALGRFDMCNLG